MTKKPRNIHGHKQKIAPTKIKACTLKLKDQERISGRGSSYTGYSRALFTPAEGQGKA